MFFRKQDQQASSIPGPEVQQAQPTRRSKRARRAAKILTGVVVVAALPFGLASAASATAVGSEQYAAGSISCAVIEDSPYGQTWLQQLVGSAPTSSSLDMTFPLPTSVRYFPGTQYDLWQATIWRWVPSTRTWVKAYIQPIHKATTGVLLNSTTVGHLNWDKTYRATPAEAVNLPSGYTYEVTAVTNWIGAGNTLLAADNVYDGLCDS
jgi:hypothetical protein